MSYHTGAYLLIFLPAVVVLYYLVPRKARWIVMLLSSYAFFYVCSKQLLVYLLAATLVAQYTGVWLSCEKLRSRGTGHDCSEKSRRHQRRIVLLGIGILLAILLHFQYYNFFVMNIDRVVEKIGGVGTLELKTLVFPIGISFYTLQAIGYMLDVYWDKIQAEENLGKMALFLAFFPQIMEGPICRYEETAEDLWQGHIYDRENIGAGLLRILWGLFKKIVIADRLNTVVNTLFDHYEDYSGAFIAAAAIGYTIQLYMEFSGSIDIVIGSAKLFGVTYPENFRQPFFSRNAKEFWQRWHMTLGRWFRDYVFYPISVSRPVKKWNLYGRKKFGKYITRLGVSAMALLPVWLCTGFWHGPRWSYLFYGLYYFAILLCGQILEPVRKSAMKKMYLKEENWILNGLRIGKTWLIIFAGELFFRANGLRAGVHMFRSMFRNFELSDLWDGTLLQLGLDQADFSIILAGCILVFLVDLIREKDIKPLVCVNKWNVVCRFALYESMLLLVVVFGAYGTGYSPVDLIYAGF